MMEIKFRAWNKNLNRSGGMIWNVAVLNGKYFDPYEMETQEYPIMQYTGLKDLKGVEIYKGDIVKVMDSSLAVVEYCKKRTAFCLKDFIDETDYWLLCQYETIEVIGNIYEDSELN